jgi:ornithine--oxo-acid transaminase
MKNHSTSVSSAAAIELEKQYGGFNYAPLPVVLSRGEGVSLWNPEGQRFLDFMSGYSCVSQGHCHPKIVRAITEQASKLTMVSRALYSDEFGPFAEYATRLLGYERMLMMNSGAEAFETGLKLARKWGYQKKKIPARQAKVIVCNDNFHGRTLGAVAVSSNSVHHEVFGPVMDGVIRIPFNDLPALEQALSDPTVCAFMVEPIQGESGINVPTEGYLSRAFELCSKNNVLLVADEIQTGLARTGKMLACQWEGVRPHITLLGKALSGGTFPISAVLADTTIIDCLQPGDHGSTFGGNPLACHVAKASLEVLVEENLAENAQRMGELFRNEMRAFASPLIQEVRGKGLLNAIVFNFGEDKEAGNRLCLEFLKRGLLAKTTRPHIIRFAPPLVINESQMREGLAIIQSSVLALSAS